MNHQDHVNLLRKGIDRPGGMWADLGSGGGAFTLALADLIGPEGMICSVGKSAGGLREQERDMRARFPETSVRYIVADFTRKMDLPPLDGVVMANSLHYVKQKDAMLQLVRSYLKPDGCFLLVEYNVALATLWSPSPRSFGTLESLARKMCFTSTQLLATVPSRFLGSMYS